jgi:hypothetical protein
MLRSLSFAVPALAICACEPDLPQVEPTPTVTAMFDPTTGRIPLPNDLVFAQHPNTVCPSPSNTLTAPTDAPACAQAELLKTFNPLGQLLTGKFPSDQELPLTIQFTKNTYVNGRLKLVAPDLDLSTITSATLAVVDVVAQKPVELAPPVASDYVIVRIDENTLEDHGTLSVHRKDHLPWDTGRYALVVRGGASGIKTKDSPAVLVAPSPVFALVEQGKDMTLPENLGLLKAQNHGSTEEALAQGEQLNGLIALYKTFAFPVADKMFGGSEGHTEMAIASTFQIDATVTNVTVDPARGLAPLPFDVLRDATTGKITAVAACSLAGGTLDAKGVCSQPAAAGFLSLDGFATTGAILAPTSAPIDIDTVDATTLKLFDMSDPKNPAEIPTDPPTGKLVREPCEFTSRFVPGTATTAPTCNTSSPAFAPVLAFQPAGASLGDPSSVVRAKPLKDNTDYAVVVTTGIKDMAGKAIGPGTVAKILRFKNPLFVGNHSALQGIDDGTAASLDKMRKQLVPVFDKLGADAANVAMAYTFHTQTVLDPAVRLAAFPYTQPSVTALPKATTYVAGSATDAFTKFGIVPRTSPSDITPGRAPFANIDQIIEVDITTFNALDPVTGAFTPPDQNGQIKTVSEQIHVLIATPLPDAAPDCPAAPNPLSAFNKCAPLAVFRHGLGSGRASMLLIADAFAAQGMVTVAIDAAKHGDRSLCQTHPDPADPRGTGCIGTCVPLAMAAGQGDPATPGVPGTCDASGLAKRPVASNAAGNTDGIAVASSNYLISANFFRTRDTLRQDLIDQSQLIRAIAFAPTGAPPTGHVVFDNILMHAATTTGKTLIIDPTTIYFAGQSLGSIQGAMDVATNPRISRAAFNVGGGTIVDVFTNAPSFATQINDLLTNVLHITKGTEQYLQFLTVAKTIVEPAEPLNFMGHLTDPATMLPNLLPPLGNPNGTVRQTPKLILNQAANCDITVPNPFNFLYASNTGPLTLPPNGTPGTFQLFISSDAASPTCPGGGGVSHSFLLDFSKPTIAGTAQTDLVNFLKTGNPVPSIEHF